MRSRSAIRNDRIFNGTTAGAGFGEWMEQVPPNDQMVILQEETCGAFAVNVFSAVFEWSMKKLACHVIPAQTIDKWECATHMGVAISASNKDHT